MPLNITNKKWPERKRRRRSSWSDMDWGTWRRFANSAYVDKGTIISKELSFKGILRPIPAGECAITALTTADNYYIYGATSGRHAHIFRYRPRGANGVVVDMGIVGKETEIRNALVVTKGGMVIGGTRSDKPKHTGWIFSAKATSYHGDFIQEWGIRESQIDLVLQPFKGEGIARMVYSAATDTIYGLTDTSGTLFIYNPETNRVKKIGRVDDRGFSTALALDDKGTLYGAGFEGHLFQYSPGTGKIEYFESYMPTFAGRAVYDTVDSLVFDRTTGCLYGGGREGGSLFRFDPASGKTVFLGKPTANARMKCLAVGNDGRLFGITGDVGDLAHLFCYDPDAASLEDLGIPLATLEIRWYGYHFDCMLTGEDGELYLGQSERVSHLFIYFPDVRTSV